MKSLFIRVCVVWGDFDLSSTKVRSRTFGELLCFWKSPQQTLTNFHIQSNNTAQNHANSNTIEGDGHAHKLFSAIGKD